LLHKYSCSVSIPWSRTRDQFACLVT